MKIRVTVKRLHFIVKILDRSILLNFEKILLKNSTYKTIDNPRTKRKETMLDKTYVGMIPRDLTYSFNSNYLRDFFRELGAIGLFPKDIELIRTELHKVDDLNVFPHKTMIPRDYQEEFIEYGYAETDCKYKLINLPTGSGKTLVAGTLMVKLGFRTIILVLPKYIEKWYLDLQANTDAIEEDIRTVSGGKELEQLIQDGKNDSIEEGFIIISLRTMSNYIKDYEVTPSMHKFKYGCTPFDFMKTVKAGTLFNDETHQEFYANFKAALYLDAHVYIGSTATLITIDRRLDRLYHIMFPPLTRLRSSKKFKRYVNIESITFDFKNPKRLQYARAQGYNHILLEQSIMRDKETLKNYLEMIFYYFERDYIKKAKTGEKSLLFFASISMCTYVTKLLRMKYPDYDVRRYVQDDPYSNILEADICVTTVLSSGTAIDIPKLQSVFQTINMMSPQANTQTVGRLRELKGSDVKFVYFWSNDIKQHFKYHTYRMELLKPTCKNYFLDKYPKSV